jgi:hypothetical protein
MKQADILAGFAIVMFLISMGMTVALAIKGGAFNVDPVMWWIAASISAHSIISRPARD